MGHPLTQTDFYKIQHIYQYPKNTNLVFSNFTARSQRHFPRTVKGTVFVGLQVVLLDYFIDEFNDKFFKQPLEKALRYYTRRIKTSLGDSVTFEHMEKLHALGYLPLRIRALPEGVVVPFKVPCMTMENTVAEFFWITNFVETIISCEVWKPCTVATIALEYRRILERYAELTGANKEMIPFSVHDFSMRGMSGRHDAGNSGVGHLLSFTGTDNIPAIDFAEDFYDADVSQELIGTSIPASEHSVACAGTREGEASTLRRFLTEIYPTGLVGFVSDTWDLWNVLEKVAPSMKDVIMNRDGKVVFRPDSGCPVQILTGTHMNVHDSINPSMEEIRVAMDYGWKGVVNSTRQFEIKVDETSQELVVVESAATSEAKGAVQILWEQFGGYENSIGYRELDPHVGLIYGDSITLDRCEQICNRLMQQGFSTGNVVFGVGSFTYQYITRDTFGSAIKATYCEVDGVGRDIFKDPVTDDGTKRSATGLLMVIKDDEGNYVLKEKCTWDEVNSEKNELKVVFENSKLLIRHNFSDIRGRVAREYTNY